MLSGNLSDEGKAQSSPRSVAPSCPVEGREDALPVLYFDSGTVIDDADYGNNRGLFLKHGHDGRDLQLEYAEKTLHYLRQLWGREVVLDTIINDKKSLLCFTDDKLTIKPVH